MFKKTILRERRGWCLLAVGGLCLYEVTGRRAPQLRSSPVIVTENDIQFSEPGPALPLCSSLYIWTGDLDLASSMMYPALTV